MFWVRRQLPIAVLALTCGGCYLLAKDAYSETGPPEDSPAKAALWWDNYVAKNENLDFLAALLEASDTHQRNGTAATYQSYFVGVTMMDRYHFEWHYPLPMPDHAAAALRERLSGHRPEKAYAGYPPFWVRDTKGCTKEQALAIWENAAGNVASKDEQSMPRPTLGPPVPATP
jgi:hypothetical protein